MTEQNTAEDTTPQAETALATRPEKNTFLGVTLSSLEDLQSFGDLAAKSGLAPKGMEKPEAIAIAVQMGAEVGLLPMQSLQNIAVINGRPAMFGDAALALIRASGLLEEYQTQEVGTPGKDDWGVTVTVRRRGFQAATETFTVADARAAGLWKKQGPWTQYPKRMLMFRARAFILRDQFGDVLKGIAMGEEVQDIPVGERNVTPSAKTLPEPDVEADPHQELYDALQSRKIRPTIFMRGLYVSNLIKEVPDRFSLLPIKVVRDSLADPGTWDQVAEGGQDQPEGE